MEERERHLTFSQFHARKISFSSEEKKCVHDQYSRRNKPNKKASAMSEQDRHVYR